MFHKHLKCRTSTAEPKKRRNVASLLFHGLSGAGQSRPCAGIRINVAAHIARGRRREISAHGCASPKKSNSRVENLPLQTRTRSFFRAACTAHATRQVRTRTHDDGHLAGNTARRVDWLGKLREGEDHVVGLPTRATRARAREHAAILIRTHAPRARTPGPRRTVLPAGAFGKRLPHGQSLPAPRTSAHTCQ